MCVDTLVSFTTLFSSSKQTKSVTVTQSHSIAKLSRPQPAGNKPLQDRPFRHGKATPVDSVDSRLTTQQTKITNMNLKVPTMSRFDTTPILTTPGLSAVAAVSALLAPVRTKWDRFTDRRPRPGTVDEDGVVWIEMKDMSAHRKQAEKELRLAQLS